MRRDFSGVMILIESAAFGSIWRLVERSLIASITSAASEVPVSNSIPVYIPSRFSRTTTRSMFAKDALHPLSDLPGRRFA